MPDFEKQSYWHERFASEHAFEWLTPSSTVMDILTPYLAGLNASIRILHLGSGTSDLHNHLRERGFLNVTNVDYEPLALERGRQLEQDRFGDVHTRYLLADATRLDLSDKYQLVIDKGTADAIACGEEGALLSMARSVRRFLDESGFWVSLSYSSQRFDDEIQSIFSVEVISKIPTPKHKPTDPDIFHHCYLLRPRG
ncbi:S-adenosyl-L-methionine-dependent methyltransferase [Thermothelomyces heterothallicus CBS 202.75]|uniref:S-adenosyl-L-methionine-dependent methyltransferase n=1 Tax=Thermothelomyces heterothallicus CBS 202.75 TaxID=1149848 RepID=UPI003743C2CB